MDSGTTRAVDASYRAGRQDTSPAVDPLPSNQVLPSRVVLPSQPVDECSPGTVYADPTNRIILQLYRQGLLQQDPASAPGVESRLAGLLDFGKHLRLRPLGEPE